MAQISFLWPLSHPDILELCKFKCANVFAMDMVPRISQAEKMDTLSSISKIRDHCAVVEAANKPGRCFKGQKVATGTVPSVNILIIGVGLAGLAALKPSSSRRMPLMVSSALDRLAPEAQRGGDSVTARRFGMGLATSNCGITDPGR